jgi:hypothetical protein
MRNLRQLRSALVVAMVIGTGMVLSGSTLHAEELAPPQPGSLRCALLLRAANAVGSDRLLGAFLQARYDAYCVAR